MKIKQEKWETLDELLKDVGFGGYYDCLECIKLSIRDILEHFAFPPAMKKKFKNKLSEEDDLAVVISLLMATTNYLGTLEKEDETYENST